MDNKQVAQLKDVKRMSFTEMLEEANHYIKASLVPFKNPADVVIVMQAARDLNMLFSAAINNFYVINGRLATGIHIINGLLIRGGIHIEVLEDYVEIGYYKTKGINRIEYTNTEMLDNITNGKFQVVTTEEVNEGKVNPNKIPFIKLPPEFINDKGVQDRRTTIRMTRMLKQPDNSYKEVIMTSTYYLSEAYQAGYIGSEKEKDVWVNHTKSMMYARCASRLGKRIAADLIHGMMELTEAADTFDVDYELIDGNGNMIPILKKDDEPTD